MPHNDAADPHSYYWEGFPLVRACTVGFRVDHCGEVTLARQEPGMTSAERSVTNSETNVLGTMNQVAQVYEEDSLTAAELHETPWVHRALDGHSPRLDYARDRQ
jgi:hypothetical protein